jgi:NADH-quinone oxidoreductase subunit E
MAWDKELKSKLEKIASSYSSRQAAALPVLHCIQEASGHVSGEDQREVAALLGMKTAEVKDVVSFFSMYSEKPRGKHILEVCTNLSCQLAHGGNPLKDWEEALGISEGETTPDGAITLLAVECIGACGTGPAVMVDDELVEAVDSRKRREIIERLRK